MVSAAQYDSNYVRKYNDRLILSLFSSLRSYELEFAQKTFPDSLGISKNHYIAQGNKISGFEVDYDKISLSLGWKVAPTDTSTFKRGKSKYSFYSLAFSWKKFRMETSYKSYKSFYDLITDRYDTTFTVDNNVPYFKNPSLQNRDIRVKGFWFRNKKGRFSYSSAYSFTYRQIKTAGSFILVSNLFNYSLKSDTGIIPGPSRPYYGEWHHWNKFDMYGLSINPGYSCNIVLFKSLFLNLTASLGTSLQYRQYGATSGNIKDSEWAFNIAAADFRSSLGLNMKNFFISVTNIIDVSYYDMHSFEFTAKFISGAFNIGYRFPFKERKWVKWLKENKYYKMF